LYNIHLLIDESMRDRLSGISSLYAWWYLELLGSSWSYLIDIEHQKYMDFVSWYWDIRLI